ncbi:predicted protein [Plenodomus lingam JN3]|uniref:Predicted protein n=1 Tax=Leptosphaeria maculans (strain JN3 / isolate v23.1.3 / race Av1-4-5-6-7-8) TaxID=985895 RepID=E4ZXN3_LEPMJ|nr:predicted protein [Plenodomus lingam JN3]CBX96128.1 predicted protein [Plenodomus lingam JN3]
MYAGTLSTSPAALLLPRVYQAPRIIKRASLKIRAEKWFDYGVKAGYGHWFDDEVEVGYGHWVDNEVKSPARDIAPIQSRPLG